MQRRVTIVDIARSAGVSKSTVSLVMRGKGAAETGARVRRAMDELGYVYNRGAASLRNPQARIVGMVINDLANPFFAELAIGIERVLQGAGYVSFIGNTDESLVRQSQVVRSMLEHGATGIIICPARDTDADEIRNLQASGTPILLAIRRIAGAETPLVVSDNAAGAGRAAKHLIGLGHRRIAYLGGMNTMVVRQDRFSGFSHALREARLPVDSALDVECMPTKTAGFTAMNTLLALEKPPTAVVCYNDVVAIGAMLAAGRRGLVVGEDVCLVGFDDTAEARHASPALTTIGVDVEGLGERAASMLLGAIHKNPGPKTYVGEARLIVRESCGARSKKRSFLPCVTAGA